MLWVVSGNGLSILETTAIEKKTHSIVSIGAIALAALLRMSASEWLDIFWFEDIYVAGKEPSEGRRLSSVNCHYGICSHPTVTPMFAPLGHFRSLPCPDGSSCSRSNCVFSHRPSSELPTQHSLNIPVETPKQSVPSTSTLAEVQRAPAAVPAKRSSLHASNLIGNGGNSKISGNTEPPRKLQKLGPAQRTVAVASSSSMVCLITLMCLDSV
jgi:hypothetical protein